MNQLSTDKLLELSREYEKGTIHIAPQPDGTPIYVPDSVHGLSRWTDDPSKPWERRSDGSSLKPMMRLPDQLTIHEYRYRLTEKIWGKEGEGWFFNREEAEKTLRLLQKEKCQKDTCGMTKLPCFRCNPGACEIE